MKSQTNASNNLTRPRSVQHWLTRAGAVVLVTWAAFLLASYARQVSPEFLHLGLSPDKATSFSFNPYGVGLAFHLTLVPLALIYLFTNTDLFRRVVSRKVAPRDTLKLFIGLAVVQLLADGYNLWLSDSIGEPPLHHLTCPVVVAVGGLLGGWKVGLGLGLTTMLFRGTQNWYVDFAPELLFLLQSRGLMGLRWLPWKPLLERYVAMRVWAVVWLGVVSGLYADLAGKHRLTPLAALVLGTGTELVHGLLKVTAGDSTAVYFMLLMPNMLVTGLAMVVAVLVMRNVQARAAQHKAEAAELARARAELRALQAQINPHFLFNALNTIRYFVRTDSETARRLLLHLSEIFQRALRSGERVPLRDEVGYVKAYLALEKARLNDRLQVEWSIQAKDWLDHPVPTLILQPMVENAVIHGIATQPQGGTVRITIEQADDDLVLRVEDDGTGIPAAQLAAILDSAEAGNEGIGLRNVDSRLRVLYGEEHRLILESKVGHGTRVEIRIPVES
jgi:LytS/YehU family sensor histidine kinase